MASSLERDGAGKRSHGAKRREAYRQMIREGRCDDRVLPVDVFMEDEVGGPLEKACLWIRIVSISISETEEKD